MCPHQSHLSPLSCLSSHADGWHYEAMPPAPEAMRLDVQACSPQQADVDAERDASSQQHSPEGPTAPVSTAELALLAKLEEANRLIESDAKSLNSLSGNSASGHSRKSSDTSQISLTSG